MKNLLFAVFAVVLQLPVFAQGKKELSLEDAVSKEWSAFYPEQMWGLQWTTEDKFVYQELGGDGLYLMRKGPGDREGECIFSVSDLNQGTGIKTKYLPSFTWLEANKVVFKHKNGIYHFDTKSKQGGALMTLKPEAEHIDLNDDATQVAYTLTNDLYVMGTDGKQKVVAENRDPGVLNGHAVHQREFGITKGTFWSPSGKKLAFYKMDETMIEKTPIVDNTTKPASIRYVRYPMAGEESHHVTVGIYDVKTDKVQYLKTDGPPEQYLTCVTWGPNDKYVYIATVSRNQDDVKLNQYDVESGELVKTLFEEHDDKYVEPEHQLEFIPNNSKQFLWFSERDGFQHLYLYDVSGKLIKQVTKGDWVVKKVLGFDASGKNVFVQGTGANPTEMHIYMVNIAKGKVKTISTASGTHKGKISPSGRFIIDDYSSLIEPHVIEVKDYKGKKLQNLLVAEDPTKDYKLGTVEEFPIPASDGTQLYARMIKPSNFDPLKKYPVLVYVYGGPRHQEVTNKWNGGAYLWMRWLAEQGYIVWSLDNRGSANRGLEFEQAVHGNLGTKEMLDQLDGIKYLKNLPYVNAKKMAVHGWSFGGYMTASLMLRHPGTFRVGVAGGAVTDWNYYEIMYGEKYMESPQDNPDGYRDATLAKYADRLKGKLLMVHGTADDVVVLQHHQTFMQACIEKGVDVDSFLYPGHAHGIYGPDRVHLIQNIVGYIMENLQMTPTKKKK